MAAMENLNLVEAEQLGLSFVGTPVLHDLSFILRPGLAFVRGGEGRGKSALLQLLAGSVAPGSGSLRCRAASTFLEDPGLPAHDAVTAGDWLASAGQRHPHWAAGAVPALLEEFGLLPHIDKPMFMLSTGSRRKVGLVAAAASGAELTLLDVPFAALDSASCRALVRVLADAAASDRRAWVLADYELPAGLVDVPLSAFIDLGD
jgi:ABC-type multidrug transport system ATPase subunit